VEERAELAAEQNRRETRVTLFLAAAFLLYCPLTLALDTTTSGSQQVLLGLTTWAFLVVALRLCPAEQRIQVISMVIVATGFECLGSLVLRAYTYRLDNLPLYVPPGHGLFFLVAVRLAVLPWVERRARLVVVAVFAGSILLLARGLLQPTPDLFGFGSWLVLVPFLFCSRFGFLYAISFGLTMALEYYGTTLGNWAWAPESPILGLPTGNPPAAIGVGYCIMDSLARAFAPRVQVLRVRLTEHKLRASGTSERGPTWPIGPTLRPFERYWTVIVPRMLGWMRHM